MTHDSIGHLENVLHEHFYHRAVVLSLNGNAAAHLSALKNTQCPSMNPALIAVREVTLLLL